MHRRARPRAPVTVTPLREGGDMQSNPAFGAVAELAASQHGVFTRTQAASTGLHRNQLARAVAKGIVEPAAPGVLRFTGAPATWRSRLAAATLTGTNGAASHRAAATLFGLDGIRASPVEVSYDRGRHGQQDKAVVHRWTAPDPGDFVVVDGIRSTNVAVTLAQLGAVVDEVAVEKALDDALRRGAAEEWIREIGERLHRPGPTGTGVLLRLLDDPIRKGTIPDSYFERLSQRILNDPQLPTPVLQHSVELGTESARIDIAWPDVKYGVECHSRTFHFGPSKKEADNIRDQRLAALGWHIDYVTWHQTKNPADFIAHIRAVHATRTRQLRAA